MASRLVKSAAGAARLRPSLSAARALPALSTPITSMRSASSQPSSTTTTTTTTTTATTATTPASTGGAGTAVADPKLKAQSILDSLPGSNLASKTAILSSAAGLSVYALSNEYYVLNEESVVAFCLLAVWGGLIKYGGPMYKEWAETQTNRIKGILNAARADHTQAVQNRIENVQQMGGVVDITKGLFAVSKETAKLESQVYELEQKTALAAEAKNVLDSWVRYEGQVKQRQQKELAEAVMAKVHKELENPKVLQQILQQSIADVERIVSSKPK